MIPPDTVTQFEQLHGCQFAFRQEDDVILVHVYLPCGNNRTSHIQEFLATHDITHHITYVDAGSPSSPFYKGNPDNRPPTGKG